MLSCNALKYNGSGCCHVNITHIKSRATYVTDLRVILHDVTMTSLTESDSRQSTSSVCVFEE